MGKKAAEVKQGFRRAGLWLLGGGWLGLIIAGIGIGFRPGPGPPAFVGWALLAVAAAIALLTMDHWVKVFPGLIGYGVLGSILELTDGHAVNLPQDPVSRTDAITSLLFCVVGAAVSVTFARRKLRATDRVALFGFLFSFVWYVADPKSMQIALGTGMALMLFAWLYDRLQRRRGHRSRSASHGAGAPRRRRRADAGLEPGRPVGEPLGRQ